MREPKQKRSIEKKEKILAAAYELFGSDGYHKTSTPDIAARAGVSIGCLYSYFEDKHAIFMELLDASERNFTEKGSVIYQEIDEMLSNPRSWFDKYIRMLIEEHEKALGLQREEKTLYFYDAAVREHMDRNRTRIQETALKYILKYRDVTRVEDAEAAAVVSSDIIEAIVERVSVYSAPIEKERVLKEGLDALCRYLFN